MVYKQSVKKDILTIKNHNIFYSVWSSSVKSELFPCITNGLHPVQYDRLMNVRNYSFKIFCWSQQRNPHQPRSVFNCIVVYCALPQRMTPKAQTSIFSVHGSLRMTSGAIQATVPAKDICMLFWSSAQGRMVPKSEILTRCVLQTSTLYKIKQHCSV